MDDNQIQIGSFLLPTDPDTVLDTITEETYQKDKFLPYWAENWPSSSVLLSYLTSNRPAGLTCELGCGLGVIASVLSAKGCAIVPIDISPDACKFASTNIFRNNGTARVTCCDWRNPPFKVQFDTLIASDILYEERWIFPVLNLVSSILKNEGKLIIADPCRKNWALFQEEAKRRGFKVDIVLRKTVNEQKAIVEIAELIKR